MVIDSKYLKPILKLDFRDKLSLKIVKHFHGSRFRTYELPEISHQKMKIFPIIGVNCFFVFHIVDL